MGQLGVGQADGPIKGVLPAGLPSGDDPSDCSNTYLQYRSRHWTTSFRLFLISKRWGQILCLSTFFTLRVLLGASQLCEMAPER